MAHNDDGRPHFTYFDWGSQLSFVWDGIVHHPIEVCHGGYGEPVSDTIPLEGYGVQTMASADGWLQWFASICTEYVYRTKEVKS